MKVFSFLTLFVIFVSCQGAFSSEREFLKWLDNPDNGLVKIQKANSFVYKMKFLPANYLEKSSLMSHKGSITFLFTVESVEPDKGITNYNVKNLEDFKKRIGLLNFDLKNYIFIRKDDGQIIKPVLTSFLNTYEIGFKKSFFIVFEKKIINITDENLSLIFDDYLLDTGINNFTFKVVDLKKIQKLKF